MELKIIINKHFPLKGFVAMTIWPFVFVRSEKKNTLNTKVVRHETTHALQQLECVYLPFFIIYCVEWLLKIIFCKFDSQRAYMSISFEQEAYEHQDEFGYNNVRKHFAWIRYIFTIK